MKPAKVGSQTNLNLITASGNIYSFVLSEVSEESQSQADVKIFIEPKDDSMMAATGAGPKFVAVKELEAAKQQVEQAKEETRRAWNGLKTLSQAKIALLAIAIASAGIYAVTPYLTLFVKTITHAKDDTNGVIAALVLMLSTALGVAPFGWLTDKVGAKWVTLIGCGIISVACIGALWAVTMPQIIIVLVIAGVGNGAYQGASYPLLTELVPREELGLYTGFLSTARSLAQPGTTLITGMLINNGHGSYRVIFGVCAVTMFLAMAILPRLRLPLAVEEIARHRAETAA